VVPAAVAQGQALWDAYRTPGRLLDAFLWTKQYYAANGGLGFYNFVQHPLALSFVYASRGQLEQAYAELDECGPDLEPELKEDIRGRLAALADAA
jgi:hypothetical protein